MDAPSLDGRWFRMSDGVTNGDIGPSTVFRYGEEDGEVWAVYAGGSVRRGYLVGTRDGDRVEFRCVQLNAAGRASGGHCVATVGVLADGRLRMDETWEWEGDGHRTTSVSEEIPEG
jgi:hypothetical protein